LICPHKNTYPYAVIKRFAYMLREEGIIYVIVILVNLVLCGMISQFLSILVDYRL
jgi:hypothetical protein